MAAEHGPGHGASREERQGQQEGGKGGRQREGSLRPWPPHPALGAVTPPHGHPLVSEPGRAEAQWTNGSNQPRWYSGRACPKSLSLSAAHRALQSLLPALTSPPAASPGLHRPHQPCTSPTPLNIQPPGPAPSSTTDRPQPPRSLARAKLCPPSCIFPASRTGPRKGKSNPATPRFKNPPESYRCPSKQAQTQTRS